MAAISPTYASPGLRWGLALEDHPGAYVAFHESPGTDLGIPEKHGGNDAFCVATIHFPEGSGRLPVIGYKALSSKIKGELDHPSDRWNILCTKALGRALKRAGYPDDLPDLKALVVWRQRDAEIRAITAGTAQVQLAAADPGRALESAAKVDPEATSRDDSNAPETDVIDVGEAESEPDGADPTVVPPSEATKAELRTAINALGPRSSELTKWARSEKIRVTRPDTEAEARALIARAAAMLAEGPAADEAPAAPVEDVTDAIDVAEVIAGLDGEQRKALDTFVTSIGGDPKLPIEQWAPDVIVDVVGWLAVG